MKTYTQQELDRMGRSQLMHVIKELNDEIQECHELLNKALDEFAKDETLSIERID